MLCPHGHKKGTKVVDSRIVKNGRAIRRRRECVTCALRFTTYEEQEVIHLFVKKRDGSREEYDQHKMRSGIMKALKKRPHICRINEIIQKIEYDLFKKVTKGGIINSVQIGRTILVHLKNIDDVAYLRFASVYKQFGSIKSFRKELDKLNT